MTLDEAIERARWCANESTGECSEEHRQLAEWLTELQKLRATRTRLLAEIHGLRSQNDKLQAKCATLTRDNIRLSSDNGMLLTHLKESWYG